MAVDVHAIANNLLAQSTTPSRSTLSDYNFSFTPFLTKTYLFGLPPDRPICKAFQEGHCPLGSRCPERHPSDLLSKQTSYAGHHFKDLVCKHWLRGLCKRGDQCEFLHEYNLRRMPECTNLVKLGYCPSGDECLYLHVRPEAKLPPCENYDNGFCELGPRCAKRHVRGKLCKFYVAGFCPDGRDCKEGAHPSFSDKLPKPSVRLERSKEEMERETREKEKEAQEEREREWRKDRDAGGSGRGRGGRGRFGRRR
jgi:cleavage and polyadenylation specificity factor subunit 4